MEKSVDDTPSTNTSLDSLDVSGSWTVVTKIEIQNAKCSLIPLEQQNVQEKIVGVQQEIASNENNGQKNVDDVCKVDRTTKHSTEKKIHEDSSDEISIISECDSTDNTSSLTNVIDHLQNFHLQFATNTNNNNTTYVPELIKTEYINKKSTTFIQIFVKRFSEIKSFIDSAINFKKGFHVGFYIGIALTAFAVINKTYNPYWDKALSKIDDLNRKIDDMEMYNNLMRAEIDLLHKQMKYLLSINERRQNKKHRKRRSFRDDDNDDDDDDNKYDKYKYNVDESRRNYKQSPNNKANKRRNENEFKDNKKMEGKYKSTLGNDEEYRNDGSKRSFECSGNSRNEDVCIKAHEQSKWITEQYNNRKRNKNNENIHTMEKSSNTYETQTNSNAEQKYTKDHDSKLKKLSKTYQNDYKENKPHEYDEKSSFHKENPEKQQKQKVYKEKKNKKYDGEWHINYMKNRENARQTYINHNEENWFLKRSNARQDKRHNEDNFHYNKF